ncbi:M64 family metallo-endopeptidase [Flavobacteriaceae bacterium]|nr:M64 family metallo-endopeptidase [Flavobacteriaceae bacterium]
MTKKLLLFSILFLQLLDSYAQKNIEFNGKSTSIESYLSKGLRLVVSGTYTGSETITVTDLGTGTATSGTDYTFTSPQVITIPAGTHDKKDITIPTLAIIDDTTYEGNETIKFSSTLSTGLTSFDVDADGTARNTFDFIIYEDDEDTTDSDNDGMSDIDETANGFNPNLANDWSYDISLVHGTNANLKNRILVTVLSEGYTEASLSTFATDVNHTVEYMFEGKHEDITNNVNNPYYRYANFFNMYRLDFASTENGIDKPDSSEYATTAFNIYANGRIAINQGYHKARKVAAESLTQELGFNPLNDTNYTVLESIIHGDDTYSNVGAADLSVCSRKYNDWIYSHESGHSWHNLADMYTYSSGTYTGSEPWQFNLTLDNTGAKWSRWTGYNNNLGGIGAVGVFEGGYTYNKDIYRPTEKSIMGDGSYDYNAVEREEIILRIYDVFKIKPLDSHTTIKPLHDSSEVFTANVIDSNVIKLKWYVDGTLVDSDGNNTFDYDWSLQSEGIHTLKAYAYDEVVDFSNYKLNGYNGTTNPHPKDMVRKDLDKLKQEVEWEVLVNKGNIEKAAFDASNYLATNTIKATIFTTNLTSKQLIVTTENGDSETLNFISNGTQLVAQITTNIDEVTQDDGIINISKNDMNKEVSFTFNGEEVTTKISVLENLLYSFSFEDNTTELSNNEDMTVAATSYVVRDDNCDPTNKAFSFNSGSNRYLTFDNVDLQTLFGGTASMSFHIKTTQTGGQYPWQTSAFYGYKDYGATNDVQWGWIGSNGEIRISTGPWNTGAASTTTINDGVWRHITLTRNSDTGRLKVYVNGVLEGDLNSKKGIYDVYQIYSIGTKHKVTQNQTPTNVTGRDSFVADIDDLRIFDVALNDDEVTKVYNLDKNCEVTLNNEIIDSETSNFKLLSNPITDSAKIDLGIVHKTITVNIYNIHGQHISNLLFKNKKILEIPIEGNSGFYVIQINNNTTLKVLKK